MDPSQGGVVGCSGWLATAAAAVTVLIVGLPGCERGDELPEPAVAWESVDDPALTGGDAEEILDVALVDGRLVAVGATAPRPSGEPPVRIGRPAVWLSDDDGASWRRVADDRIMPTPRELAQHERAAMTEVVALEHAAGWRLVAAGPATRIKDLLVWISDDRGESWQLAPDQRALVGESLGALSATQGVVALGTRLGRMGRDFDRPFEVEVRVSLDGRRWQRLSRPLPVPSRGGAQLEGVAAHQGRFVALGADLERERSPLVWMSDDGLTWGLVGPERHGFRRDVELHALTSGPVGFVAAGRGRGGATIWESDDGVGWTEVAALPAELLRFLSLAAHDDGRVAAVATMPAGPESARHLFLVLGDDGRWRWTRTAEEPLRVAAVVSTADGFLAVGAVAAGDASDAAVWTYTAGPVP